MQRVLIPTLVVFCAGVGGCGGESDATLPPRPSSGTLQANRPAKFVGTWRWTGNPDEVCIYIFQEDGRAEGLIDGKEVPDSGRWSVENGCILVHSATDQVSFRYRIDDDTTFTQIDWNDHGKKKLIENPQPWIKVDSIDEQR